MAINIPVNLISVAIPLPQQSASQSEGTNAVGGVATVQPTTASSNTSGTFTNNGSGQNPSEQQAQASKKSPDPQPPKAEAKSVVTAQIENRPPSEDSDLSTARRAAEANQAAARTDALVKSMGESPKETSITLEKPEQEEAPIKRQSEIDRYAPPDPLPTAPILKAAESYSAASKRD